MGFYFYRGILVENQNAKINRSVKLVKGFMALVIIMQLVQYLQTSVLDFGAIAGAIGVLSLLRALLLSPSLLATPIKYWSWANFTSSKDSYFYFILAFVLIVVSSF